jgi:hypothetical protein
MSGFFEKPKIGKPLGVLIAAVAALAVIATAIVMAYRAGSDAASPSSDATETAEVEAEGLPGADQTYDPLQVVDGAEYDPELFIFRGYERTYVGAVSAASNWITAAGSSLDPDYSEQLGEALLAQGAEQTPADWRDWPEDRREDLGAPASDDLEAGWGLNATPMAYQTNVFSDTEVEVILLVRLTGTSPYGSVSRNTILTMDLTWTGHDWADVGNLEYTDRSSLHVDPGEETSDTATSLGWHQLIR